MNRRCITDIVQPIGIENDQVRGLEAICASLYSMYLPRNPARLVRNQLAEFACHGLRNCRILITQKERSNGVFLGELKPLRSTHHHQRGGQSVGMGGIRYRDGHRAQGMGNGPS